ncbi:MAG: autotransporter outer membrane beta-barrel domain-containing protein [Desulfovibrio sp.]|nr:autotransporter outer membrane beta-barrel domain-containing protein [Desulfovibrio sp.]
MRVLDKLYIDQREDPNATDMGRRFLSRAVNDLFIGNDPALAAKTVESAARFAELGAVPPQMTMAAVNAAGNAITQRTTIASTRSRIQSVRSDGTVEYAADDSHNAWGMKAGNYDIEWNGGLGGIALGADYTLENAIRAGITFNTGGGYTASGGDLADTTNKFNFWGLGSYVGWADRDFGLTADINYTSLFNDVKQEEPSGLRMQNLKSDIISHAVSAGLRLEYRIETSALDIVPHVGIRFMNLATDSYDVKSGGTVLEGDQINQNIWTFPIGFAFSKNIATDKDWFLKPILDLAVIPATGDIEGKSRTRFTGAGTKAELENRAMDHVFT